MKSVSIIALSPSGEAILGKQHSKNYFMWKVEVTYNPATVKYIMSRQLKNLGKDKLDLAAQFKRAFPKLQEEIDYKVEYEE